MAAIVAYTHDLQKVEKDGNVYYELNVMLRQRGAAQRAVLVKVWGGFSSLPGRWSTCGHSWARSTPGLAPGIGTHGRVFRS